jgi:hypothetical protein
MLAVVADKASYVHHTRPICSEEYEKNLGMYLTLKRAIPESETFILESSKMI